jgi:hypothetical protein
MGDSNYTRFLFHGEGSVASGILTGPTQDVIDVQAPSSLPVIGGTSSSRVENFAHRTSAGNVLSFSVGTSQALGYRVTKPGLDAWETVVTTTLENLNIMDVITADRVVARVASSHPVNVNGCPTVTTVGSTFQNLRIAGCAVEVELAVDHADATSSFHDFNTSAERSDTILSGLLAKAAAAVPSVPTPSAGTPSSGTPSSGTPSVAIPVVGGTLVTKVTPGCGQQVPFSEKNGVVVVKGFGTIYLAEFIAKPHERSLTMIRVELGCPPSGSVCAGTGKTNGTPIGN